MRKPIAKISCILIAAALMAGALSGCNNKNNETDMLPLLTGITVEKRDLEDVITSEGEVQSMDGDSVIVTELIGCKVKKVFFQVGDKVNEGDVVCELDSSELENEIAELEKAVSDSSVVSDYEYKQLVKNLDSIKKSGDLQIEAAQRNLDSARSTLNDLNNRYQQKVDEYNSCISGADECMAQAEVCDDAALREAMFVKYAEYKENAAMAMEAYELIDAERKETDAQIKILENQLEQTKLDVKNQISSAQFEVDSYNASSNDDSQIQKTLNEKKKLLEKTNVKAEKSGIISSVNVEEGNICKDGLLMTVQSDSDVHVCIDIKEENLLSIEKGMRASVSILAKPGKTYEGKVEKVNPIKNDMSFLGFVSLDDSTDFRVGMVAGVKIYIVDKKDVLAVKNSAVFENDDKEKCVYEAVDNGDGTYTAKAVKITEVEKTKNYTEIGEGSLKEDAVILSNSRAYSDGMVFRLNVEKNDMSEENSDIRK